MNNGLSINLRSPVNKILFTDEKIEDEPKPICKNSIIKKKYYIQIESKNLIIFHKNIEDRDKIIKKYKKRLHLDNEDIIKYGFNKAKDLSCD